MVDFNKIESTQENFGTTILKTNEADIIATIEKFLNDVGFKHSDFVNYKGFLNVLNDVHQAADFNVVPYYVFAKTFLKYSEYLLQFYNGMFDEKSNVNIDFTNYRNQLQKDVETFEFMNYDLSIYPQLETYEKIINDTTYALDPLYGSLSIDDKTLKRYPFNLVYPVIKDNIFHLYHNTNRLAICSIDMSDIMIFNENTENILQPYSNIRFTNFKNKMFNLLTSSNTMNDIFCKNNTVVKNIILDFGKPSEDLNNINMVVDEYFLRYSFEFFKDKVQDTNGLDFYNFYLSDRFEKICVIFNVDLSMTDHNSDQPYVTTINFSDIVNYCTWIKSILHFSSINICFMKDKQDIVSIYSGGQYEDINIINEKINEKINNALGMHCCITNKTN